ncbi:hypothetical protein Leryth_011178 [Lithospermum erythrorhizon]|nr:hypothetical protein Leryth_011178 [Lithospermum erythrorhizon]
MSQISIETGISSKRQLMIMSENEITTSQVSPTKGAANTKNQTKEIPDTKKPTNAETLNDNAL